MNKLMKLVITLLLLVISQSSFSQRTLIHCGQLIKRDDNRSGR